MFKILTSKPAQALVKLASNHEYWPIALIDSRLSFIFLGVIQAVRCFSHFHRKKDRLCTLSKTKVRTLLCIPFFYNQMYYVCK